MWALAFRQLPAYTSLYSYTLISIWSGIYIFYNWIPARIYTELHKYLHIYTYIYLYYVPTYPCRYPNTPTYLPSLHLYDPISTFLLFRSFTFIFLHVHLIPTPISMYTHIYTYIYLGNYKSLALILFNYTPLRRSAQNTSMFLPC